MTALLSAGASAIVASKLGSTALDMAKELHFDDIEDILASKTSTETGEWLSSCCDGKVVMM